MNRVFPWRGLAAHLLLTLRLNFRSRAPLIYGYLVPVFFLLAFGSVFRGGSPPLLHEMSQLVTITILGGTCFGLPTAIVAERDAGVWRRYRLLPASAPALVFSALAARTLLVGSAVLLQFALSWLIYRTPWPARPLEFLVAFGWVCCAFLGMGLMIAMLADHVPAVQAIGQCVFLPMIMLGGVGVPLRMLPPWAQRVADFMPGRYAVEAFDACVLPAGGGLAAAHFALAALSLIGAAAMVAGFGLFRWEAGSRSLGRAAQGWIALALCAWLLTGGIALARQVRAQSVSTRALTGAAGWKAITDAEIDAVRYGDLTPDESIYVPVASSFDRLDEAARSRVEAIEDTLTYWPPGRVGAPDQRVRFLLAVAAVADVTEDENEGEIALAVFGQIRTSVPAPDLVKILTWIITHPTMGKAQIDPAVFGLKPSPDETVIRERSAAYAKKLLWRLRHPGQRAPSAPARQPDELQ